MSSMGSNKRSDIGGDDFIHRLNSWYTFLILLVAALVVTVAPMVTNPLSCYTTSKSNISVAYAEKLCWRGSLYTADRYSQRGLEAYSYRHYTGVVWVGQALLFLAILLFWHFLQALCGLRLNDVTRVTSGALSSDPVTRDWSIKYLVKRTLIRSRGCNYSLTCCALAVKILYCMNAILQLTFTSAMFKLLPGVEKYRYPGLVYRIFALDIMIDVENAMVHNEEVTFPRNVKCFFSIYTSTDQEGVTAHCEVVISQFYENIFAALWLWLLFVCVVTCIATVLWTLEMFIPPIKNAYVTDRLVATGRIPDSACANRSFASSHCSGDAYLVTRHIRLTGSDATAAEVVAGLWDEYQEKTTANAPDRGSANTNNTGTLSRHETPL